MITIIYNKQDGEIVSIAHGVIPHVIPGCDTINVEKSSIDPQRHKVIDGCLVEKTADLRPKLTEINMAIARELQYSDRFMMPDYPITDNSAWIVYRKALRDLSKGNPTVEQMITRFPQRPDGTDVGSGLRARNN